jgi:hypothetical protein
MEKNARTDCLPATFFSRFPFSDYHSILLVPSWRAHADFGKARGAQGGRAMTEYQRLRLQELVDQYVRSRSKAGAVSVAAACRAIRTVMPDCPLAEQDLEDQIFQAAMRHGHSVHLDGSLPMPGKGTKWMAGAFGS